MAAPERGRTVFVRNLSYDIDDKALEEAFNDVGPVRQAFIVKDKGQQRHKGYGYVQFALPEDAERAVQELHGRALHGRAIKVRRLLPTVNTATTAVHAIWACVLVAWACEHVRLALNVHFKIIALIHALHLHA